MTLIIILYKLPKQEISCVEGNTLRASYFYYVPVLTSDIGAYKKSEVRVPHFK